MPATLHSDETYDAGFRRRSPPAGSAPLGEMSKRAELTLGGIVGAAAMIADLELEHAGSGKRVLVWAMEAAAKVATERKKTLTLYMIYRL